MNELALEVAAWLETLPGMKSVKPCLVTIDGQTFAGAHYIKTMTVSPGCPAYNHGKREYESESFYMVGNAPKKAAQQKKMFKRPPVEWCCKYVWRREGDERDWYGGGGYQVANDPDPEAHKQYHPFGNNFMLSPWDEGPNYRGDEIGKIDRYDDEPRQRLPFTILWLV